MRTMRRAVLVLMLAVPAWAGEVELVNGEVVPPLPTPGFEVAVVEKGNCWTHPEDGKERCGWETHCTTPITWFVEAWRQDDGKTIGTLGKRYGVPQCQKIL